MKKKILLVILFAAVFALSSFSVSAAANPFISFVNAFGRIGEAYAVAPWFWDGAIMAIVFIALGMFAFAGQERFQTKPAKTMIIVAGLVLAAGTEVYLKSMDIILISKYTGIYGIAVLTIIAAYSVYALSHKLLGMEKFTAGMISFVGAYFIVVRFLSIYIPDFETVIEETEGINMMYAVFNMGMWIAAAILLLKGATNLFGMLGLGAAGEAVGYAGEAKGIGGKAIDLLKSEEQNVAGDEELKRRLAEQDAITQQSLSRINDIGKEKAALTNVINVLNEQLVRSQQAAQAGDARGAMAALGNAARAAETGTNVARVTAATAEAEEKDAGRERTGQRDVAAQAFALRRRERKSRRDEGKAGNREDAAASRRAAGFTVTIRSAARAAARAAREEIKIMNRIEKLGKSWFNVFQDIKDNSADLRNNFAKLSPAEREYRYENLRGLLRKLFGGAADLNVNMASIKKAHERLRGIEVKEANVQRMLEGLDVLKVNRLKGKK